MTLRGWIPPPGVALPAGNGGGVEKVTVGEIVDEIGGFRVIIAADAPAAMRTETPSPRPEGAGRRWPAGSENYVEKIVAYRAGGR